MGNGAYHLRVIDRNIKTKVRDSLIELQIE